MRNIKTIATFSAACLFSAAGMARAGVSIDLTLGSPPPQRVWVQPVYETRTERVWVEPVTQLQTQNVWHDAVTEDQVGQTWVPDRYELQQVRTVDPYGRMIFVQQNVLVEAGHYQQTHTPIVVRAGYWGPEAVPVVVVPGYYQTVQKTVCVQDARGSDSPLCDQPVIVERPVVVDHPVIIVDHGHDHYDHDHYGPDRGPGPGPGYGYDHGHDHWH